MVYDISSYWETPHKAGWVLINMCTSLTTLGTWLTSIAFQTNVMDT